MGIALGAAGIGAGAGIATDSSLTTASLPSSVGAPSGLAAGFGAVPSIALPASLAPLQDAFERRMTQYWPDVGTVSGTREDLRSFKAPLRPRPGTSLEIVQSCRQAVAGAALAYGVVRVDAASAGPTRPMGGGYSAPIQFKIVYARSGGLETRQATVACRLNSAGRVYAAL